MCTLFWLTKTCLCVTFNIWHNVCHQISDSHSRNDVQPHDLTYEPFSVFNFSHTKSRARTLVWPMRRTVMRVHCEKTSLYATFWLTWTCPHANLLIGGRVCIQVGYKTCSCACSHTKRRVCAQFFWLTKSCLCVTLNIWHLACHIIFHRCTRNKVPHHDFLTYLPLSLCNFWLTRTSPCENCHIWRRAVCNTKFLFFISATMFPRTVSTTRVVHVRVHALKRLMSAHFTN